MTKCIQTWGPCHGTFGTVLICLRAFSWSLRTMITCDTWHPHFCSPCFGWLEIWLFILWTSLAGKVLQLAVFVRTSWPSIFLARVWPCLLQFSISISCSGFKVIGQGLGLAWMVTGRSDLGPRLRAVYFPVLLTCWLHNRSVVGYEKCVCCVWSDACRLYAVANCRHVRLLLNLVLLCNDWFNKSASILLLGSHRWRCPLAAALAADMDHKAAAIDGTDRQTDGHLLIFGSL